MKYLPVLLLAICLTAESHADLKSVSEVTSEARPGVVVVTAADRDGTQDAVMGAGFVLSDNGLIATALHVIGEGRPIWVKTQDEQRHEVVEVYATDQSMDLAILRVDPIDAPALRIAGDGQLLSQGDMTVAIGHPFGLTNKVVSGVFSGTEDVRGVEHLQVSMTIEPGNSGCPLLDMHGAVQGVIVMKSTRAQSFGFAVPVAALRRLLEKPNPISMANWRTLGRINEDVWQEHMGARWRQRSGRILVSDAGRGFGGRAFLLRKGEPVQLPFELAVSVKLDDESGAAGIAFHADGQDRHYGFYPSGGKLRLTSFEGPTVFSWNVVREFETEHYRPGEWNEIKVRVEENKVVGFVNGQQVVSVDDVRLPAGQVGLCKFRQTQAEFRKFRWGPTVPSLVPSPEQWNALATEMADLGTRSELSSGDLAPLTGNMVNRRKVLEREARALEEKAKQLRRLSADLHTASVCEQLRQLVEGRDDDEVDLLLATLWIAKLDNPDLDVDVYVASVDEMVTEIRKAFTPQDTAESKLAKLDDYLFEQHGYHGSRMDYDNAHNSHLDRVIDDREGLPITLSALYMTLAKRLGLNVVGVGLPGHFIVRHEPDEGPAQLIDVFDRGKRLTETEAKLRTIATTGLRARAEHFMAARHQDMLVRMLNNLFNVAQAQDDSAAMLRYLEATLAIDPDDVRKRGARAIFRHREGRHVASLEDLDWILERKPEGLDLREIRRMREAFSRP